MKKSSILISPYVTEKSMNHMSGTKTQKFTDGNRIEFLVHRDASKTDIKSAIEERFDVKVDKVWTRIEKTGKHAIIKLGDGYSAEEIGTRIGVL